MKSLFRGASHGLDAGALKDTVTGIGKSNKLSRRIPGNQDSMQREEMWTSASTDAKDHLVPASAGSRNGNTVFGQYSGIINRSLTISGDYGCQQSKWELVQTGSHLCFYTPPDLCF